MSVMPESAHLKGQPLVSSDGETVGTIEDVYVDPGTGQAEFLEVKAGRFRPKVHFVPVAQMSAEGGAVKVPYDKAKIVEAPKVGVGAGGGELTGTEEATLREYWAMPPQESAPL
ncbi:PRC-barrel domain-containing protein [Sporichthya sp.]|uniref:PRC-barrel domain-containing protein n=1 Tax=Sporichthya sp. TaxID=65475 RepID=UPI0017CF9740|nr:PRC-barrel domain-containing protein [Sporichthya sp.]MBA3743007.1 PRC-barrel domain-containing protein [Sporichthya sp.]